MVEPSPAPTTIADTRAMLEDQSATRATHVASWDAMRNVNPTWAPVLSTADDHWKTNTATILENIDLTRASFDSADLKLAKFKHANLDRADFTNSKFYMCDFTGIDLSTATITDGFTLTNCTANGACFDSLAAESINLSDTQADGSSFRNCRFTHADFTNLAAPNADFSRAILTDSNFTGSDLSHSNFNNADLRRCFLEDVNVARASFIRAKGLWGEQRAHLQNVQGAEWAIYHAASDFLNWSRLRFISTLRLFGVSYVAFFAILLYGGFARWQQEILSALLAQATPGTDASASTQFLNTMPHVPFSPGLGWQLVALLLLAVGSTVYAIACPALIQENSETRWSRELDNPVIEYRAALWSRPWARYLCSSFYVLGAVYTLAYIGSRFIRVVSFAIEG